MLKFKTLQQLNVNTIFKKKKHLKVINTLQYTDNYKEIAKKVHESYDNIFYYISRILIPNNIFTKAYYNANATKLNLFHLFFKSNEMKKEEFKKKGISYLIRTSEKSHHFIRFRYSKDMNEREERVSLWQHVFHKYSYPFYHQDFLEKFQDVWDGENNSKTIKGFDHKVEDITIPELLVLKEFEKGKESFTKVARNLHRQHRELLKKHKVLITNRRVSKIFDTLREKNFLIERNPINFFKIKDFTLVYYFLKTKKFYRLIKTLEKLNVRAYHLKFLDERNKYLIGIQMHKDYKYFMDLILSEIGKEFKSVEIKYSPNFQNLLAYTIPYEIILKENFNIEYKCNYDAEKAYRILSRKILS